MLGSPQSDDPRLTENPSQVLGSDGFSGSHAADNPSQLAALEEPELEAALQLLVERAQYITGATGTALALPQGGDMVCRASAGSCAPSIGARLQVRSGLTGESIKRRQLLRCDNAEADPRVNLEACRALGIASIVVLPLLRRDGEVRGLFELFSDHAYAFEERDLTALERMADLTLTALDLAEQRHGTVPSLPPKKQPPAVRQADRPTTPPAGVSHPPQEGAFPNRGSSPASIASPALIADFHRPHPLRVDVTAGLSSVPADQTLTGNGPARLEGIPQADGEAQLPDTMGHVQKCAGCGFPISEGRNLCLDCENKHLSELGNPQELSYPLDQGQQSPLSAPEQDLPPFLANAVPLKHSWFSDHVNLLAIVVIVLGVLVAIVVFR